MESRISRGGITRSGGELPSRDDELVGELHELAGEAGGFALALARVARALGAERFHLRVVSEDGAVVDEVVDGERALIEEHLLVELGGVRALAHPDATAQDRRFLMAATFVVGATCTATLVFARSSCRSPFAESERFLLWRLLPHLAIAHRYAHRIRAAESDARALRAALDALPSAVAIVDSALRVTSANDLAEELLAESDPLGVRDGKLVAPRSAASALASGVEGVLDGVRSGEPRPTRTVTVARKADAPLAIVLAPLGVGPRRRSSRLLAIFHDPSRVVQVDPRRIASLHGLTTVEAELAAALVEGLTVTEFAGRRGCTEQTARTHLKRVLEKTGTSRQTDLVRVLLADLAVHSVR